MSSESEWSCRVEGSGSQCNVLIQPNRQAVLVREKKNRTDRQEEENKGMDPKRRRRAKGERREKDVKDGRDGGRKTERGEERRACY